MTPGNGYDHAPQDDDEENQRHPPVRPRRDGGDRGGCGVSGL